MNTGLLKWGWLNGGGDDNGLTVSENIMFDNPPQLDHSDKLIIAIPTLSFVNSHSAEAFSFAGISGWWKQPGPEAAVFFPTGPGDTEQGASNAPDSFTHWAIIAWDKNLVGIQFAMRLRNANARMTWTISAA